MIWEPEAASYFTARDLRDDDEEELMVSTFVMPSSLHLLIVYQEDDSFVLVDAGGGTVDLAAFRIKKLRPDLVLEKIANSLGKCRLVSTTLSI